MKMDTFEAFMAGISPSLDEKINARGRVEVERAWTRIEFEIIFGSGYPSVHDVALIRNLRFSWVFMNDGTRGKLNKRMTSLPVRGR